MLGLFKREKAIIDEPHASNVVPRIKNSKFLAAARECGAQGDAEPIVEALAGDLVVTYAFDLPGCFQFASRRQCEELGLQGERLRATALGNFRERLPKIREEGQAPVGVLTVGHNLEACLLLLEDLWERIARKTRGEVVVAVPNRDAIFYTSSFSTLGLQVVTEALQEFYDPGQTHSLTPELFCWRDRRWDIFSQT